MSLDPRDDRRRGRSKSPGRRDERERSRSRVAVEEVETVRERSRVRVPSPPSGRYEDPRYEESRYKEYEERETTTARRGKADVVTAEPRGSYGSLAQYRDASPPRDRGGVPFGVGAAAGGVASYAMPGAFGAVEDEVDKRYSNGGGRGDREKEYYSETKTTTTGYGRGEREKEYYTETKTGGRGGGRDDYYGGGGGERGEYGRPVNAPPARSQYEDVADKYKYNDPRDSRYAGDERDRATRERGASFNVTAGHHSISGAVNVGHGAQPPYSQPQQPPYGQVQQPSPADFQYPGAPPPGRQYAEPPKWEYAQPTEKISYSKVSETTYNTHTGPASPPSQYATSRHGSQQYDSRGPAGSARTSQTKILTVEGPDSRRRASSPGPAGLVPRMHSLSVSTGHHGGAALSLAAAPGSPLLESYQGTYQSISPMPSPLMIANTPHRHGDVNLIEPLSPDSSDDDRRGGKKTKKTARFHDPVDEATILAKALKGEKRAPDTQPLIEILPGLTHEQVLDLRVEYKRIVKTGSDKKGVNIAKHIKLRLKEEDPSLMKACYACALGKWESEAYWANFWYQGEKSRRELLIESLMGRTNAEIRQIKDGFSDKKYSDSLTKCMKTELKEDKFKKAVLLVLEERKMEERPGYGIDRALVEDDVHDLYKAVRSEKGGETAMINIVVVRSDAHLREVLRLYEGTYRANFAREMLKKSGNLVGEMLAHILNGVINKPVRDALLIHHALSLSKSDSIRTELLISRLVRYHWDRPHMEAVKREYRARYGTDMQVAVREGTRGEWGHFCEMLCVRRMGDEVREMRRVEEYTSVRVERR